MANTTLILGAGLGKEYGFPDGPELRELIVAELPEHERELRHIVRWENSETVDEIAAWHPDHADQLRRIVVTILRSRESEETVQRNGNNTYKLMLKQIADAQLGEHSVKIITFNYDRSLQFLLHNLNSAVPGERRIQPDIIRAIFGRLAPMWFEDPNRSRPKSYHEYGYRSLTQMRLREEDGGVLLAPDREQEQSALMELWRGSKLTFIGEAKGPDTSDARSLLEASDQIFLLGMAYHEANMKVLGFDFGKRYSDKIIAGTGLLLGAERVKALLEQYPAIDAIEPCDAYTFLRTKFNISEVEKNRSRYALAEPNIR